MCRCPFIESSHLAQRLSSFMSLCSWRSILRPCIGRGNQCLQPVIQQATYAPSTSAIVRGVFQTVHLWVVLGLFRSIHTSQSITQGEDLHSQYMTNEAAPCVTSSTQDWVWYILAGHAEGGRARSHRQGRTRVLWTLRGTPARLKAPTPHKTAACQQSRRGLPYAQSTADTRTGGDDAIFPIRATVKLAVTVAAVSSWWQMHGLPFCKHEQESTISFHRHFLKAPLTRLFKDQLHVCVVQDVQAVIGRTRQLAFEKHVLHAHQEVGEPLRVPLAWQTHGPRA